MRSESSRSVARPALAAAVMALGLLFAIASPASAQTGANDHVVSPSGDDAGPGTDARPWKTMTHAMRQLQPGDTLFVRAGIYRNQLTFVSTAGTASAPIRIRNYPGERPSIVGQDGVSAEGHKVWGAIHLVEPAAHLDFRGFNIRGWGRTVDVAGVQTWRAHHITIARSQIHQFGGGGINATESENIRILANSIHHNAFTSWRATSGVSLYKSAELGGPQGYYSNEIRNNYIWANENKETGEDGLFTDGNCIVIDRFNEADYAGRTAVTNNVCANNGGRGVHVFRSDNVDVIHNTLYQNARTPGLTGEGELSTYDADNVRFINNLVQPRPGMRASLPWLSTNLVFNNNVYLMPGGAQPWEVSAGSGDRVLAWGHFVRPVADARGNFRLRITGPVIDTGRATSVRWDKAFQVRSGTVEAGAFDFHN